MLVFYLIFMWLFGGGCAYSFWKQDKEAGKNPSFAPVPLFVLFFPVIIPIILGVATGEYLRDENKENG